MNNINNKAQDAKNILSKMPDSYNYIGDVKKGEIQVDVNFSSSKLEYEDEYIAIIKDPVIFPEGKRGHYIRIIEKGSIKTGIAGVVIIPFWSNKIALLENFRHPTRSWELELPRGFINPKESIESNARLECQEELEVNPRVLSKLGDIKINTGLMSSIASVFIAELSERPGSKLKKQKEEAIKNIQLFSIPEVNNLIKHQKIQDSFTLSAISMLQAQDY